MIIWSGKGLLVLLAFGLGILIGGDLAKALATQVYFSSAAQMKGVERLVAAVLNFVLSKLLVSDGSSLFFIPNKYWTVLFAGAGIWKFFGAA